MRLKSTNKLRVQKEMKSVFEEPARLNFVVSHRIVVSVGAACVLVLIATCIVIMLVPADQWESSGIKNKENSPKTVYSVQHIFANHVISTKMTTTTCSFRRNEIESICTIICSNVVDDHPGHVAAQYVTEHVNDPKEFYQCDEWELEIRESKFPNGTINKNWLQNNDGKDIPIVVRSLRINSCLELHHIESEAFSYTPALGKNLKRLIVERNPELREITSGITDGLEALLEFSWKQNGVLQRADQNSFLPFTNTLQVLRITGGVSSGTVMANITGNCQKDVYPYLEVLDISYSSSKAMAVMSISQISAITKLTSLYMKNSGIEMLENANIFHAIASTITAIDMSGNSLRTIENGTFDMISYHHKQSGTSLQLSLEGNAWHCDCNLEWLPILLRNSNSIILNDMPLCSLPLAMKGVPLITANMTSAADCAIPMKVINPGDIICSYVPIAPDIVTTTDLLLRPTESIPCQKYVPRTHRFKRASNNQLPTITLPTTLPGFAVSELPNEGEASDEVIVVVHTGIPVSEYYGAKSLVWTDNEKETGCYVNVVGAVEIYNLTQNKAYVFCILDAHASYAPPNHCVALTTQPVWASRPWLTNNVKVITIAGITCAFLFSVICSATCVVYAFWRKPTLLTFNKRVVKVRTSRHDAVIMPPDTRNSVQLTQKNTALSINVAITNSDSQSVNSDPSYISIKNASKLSLFIFDLRNWLRRGSETNKRESNSQGTESSEFPSSLATTEIPRSCDSVEPPFLY